MYLCDALYCTIFILNFQGDVYAVDESTLFIKGFAYDGTGPDAFFWVGKTARPSPEGYIIPYPEDYVGRFVIPILLHFSINITLSL